MDLPSMMTAPLLVTEMIALLILMDTTKWPPKQVQETKQTRIKDQEENLKKQDELEKKVELLLRGLLAFGGIIFCRNQTLLLQNFVGLLGWTSNQTLLLPVHILDETHLLLFLVNYVVLECYY